MPGCALTPPSLPVDAPTAPDSGPGSRSGSRERGSSDAAPGETSEGVPPPRRHDPGRFRLQLGGPRAEALARRRRRAQEEVLELLPESALELDPDTLYGPGEGRVPQRRRVNAPEGGK